MRASHHQHRTSPCTRCLLCRVAAHEDEQASASNAATEQREEFGAVDYEASQQRDLVAKTVWELDRQQQELDALREEVGAGCRGGRALRLWGGWGVQGEGAMCGWAGSSSSWTL